MKKIAEVLEFEVPGESPGIRLDQFLSHSYREFSRTYIKRLIEEGFVFVNSREVRKPSYRVREGDQVVFHIPEPEPVAIEPENIPIQIIHEDEEIAVIIKPCGLVVHPSPGHTSGTLVNALLYHLGSLSSEGGVERAGIVHRLDKDTSGLMVVAKTDRAHRELTDQFARRQTLKLYRALVSGVVEKDHFEVNAPIGRHPVNRKKFTIHGVAGRSARTEAWVLERFENIGVTLLKLRIYTGRTHQIRVHLSSIGHPVLGDVTYGFKRRAFPPELNELISECNMLVAYRIGFRHPANKQWLEFEIDDPEPFNAALEKIRDLNSSLR